MIRQASPHDVRKLAWLEGLLFSNALNEQQIERELNAGEGLVLGDPAYAYALLRRDGELLDLVRLAVEPRYQGTGAARALLSAILDRGLPVILTVQKDNERALRLYQKQGFRIVGHFSAERAWAMRWDPCGGSPSTGAGRTSRTTGT